MSYTALYRKFRPVNFSEVKGQDHIVKTLKNQIKSNRIGHAYLFTGTRGTGKTTIAKIFAKTVNCEDPINGSPCGECKSCKAIAAGASMNVIEIDAASNNGVDNIREIVEEVSYSPAEGKYKVYIIDEVHMLSIGAFNALLKTLEEPPSYVIFILATTEVHKIPITILSRCQRYDFKRISIDMLMERMQELVEKEQVQIEEKALRYIAKAADGSARDALSLLDQCIAFHFGEELSYEKVLDVLGAVDTGVFSQLLRNVLARDVLKCIELLETIVMQGRELTQFVNDFIWYLRNLLLVKASDNIEDILEVSSENYAKLKEEAEMTEMEVIMRYIRIFSELSGQIRYASQKRILIEMALIKLCKPSMETKQDALLDRIREVEDKLENGIVVNSVAGDQAVTMQQPKEKPKLPAAIPAEIEQIVKNWPAVMAMIDNPMRTYLKGANLSLAADSSLMIVVQDGIGSDYFTKVPENVEALKTIISNYIEKEVPVTVQAVASRQDFVNNYVDLSQVIRMEIEEEDF